MSWMGKQKKTKAPEELDGLIDKILGPLSTEDFGLSDLTAARDKIATYQAIALVFLMLHEPMRYEPYSEESKRSNRS